jgi:hypothetical protein
MAVPVDQIIAGTASIAHERMGPLQQTQTDPTQLPKGNMVD